MRPRFTVSKLTPVLAGLLILSPGVSVWAQDLLFVAKVDKTTVPVREPITLTLTLSGDIADVQLPALTFPEGFLVAARSQATSFSIRAGATERSTSASVVLIAQQPGTFQLGPFTVTHQHKTFQTQPLEVTIEPAVVPPPPPPNGERFNL